MRDPMIAIALCALCVTACSRRSDDARTPAAPTPIQADIANATAHDETSPAEEPGAAAQLVVRGTLLAEHDVALPSDAALRIQIRDVSMVDVAARILARDEMPIERLPAEFNISAPRAAIAPNARIAIFAQVFSGDRLLYMTTTHTPVDTQTPMNVRLQQISAVRDEAGGPVAGGAGAVGRSAIGAGADGSGADGMMITPPQDRFDCGGEALLVAIEAGGAFVTFADTSTRLLPLMTPPGETDEKSFSNGEMTLFVKSGEVAFARGRAAPLLCAGK